MHIIVGGTDICFVTIPRTKTSEYAMFWDIRFLWDVR